MHNIGTIYERRVATISDVLVEVGGLSKSIMAFFYFISYFFEMPFRMLDISISFRQLQQSRGEELFCEESK